MGSYVSEKWYGNPHALRARDRRGGRFDAYVPHPLKGWNPLLPADAVAFLAEAAIIVLLNPVDLSVGRATELTVDAALANATYRKHVNGHVLRPNSALMSQGMDISDRLRTAARAL